MSVDEERNNERNSFNNRTNLSPTNNQKIIKPQKRNKSNYNFHNKKPLYSKETILNNNEDEYNGLTYKNKIQIPNKNSTIIKILPSNYNNNYDFKKKFKTEICHFWEMNGYCKYGDNCAFAHGESELKNRKMSFNYKTKPCKQFFEMGYCTYGSRCQFSHKKDSFLYSFSYLKSLSELISNEKINEGILSRPRLNTFEILAHSNIKKTKENRIKLYEDIKCAKHEMNFTTSSFISNISNYRNRLISV